MKRVVWFFLLLGLISCGGQAVEETAVPPSATPPEATATAPPTATPLPEPTETPPPTATESESVVAQESSPTQTPVPPTPTSEFVVLTATPSVNVPAVERVAIAAVEQPPYAESDCSDKYPCNEDVAAWEARVQVPDGFKAAYFARVEGSPTTMTFGPDGLLYVAVLDGTLYTIDGQGSVETFFTGLQVPTGMAFQPGTDNLYISDRVINESVNGESQVSLLRDGELRQIVGGLPCCYAGLHAANGIAFGPDGYGYVSVGGRADHGEILLEGETKGQQDELHPLEAAIVRFHPDGSDVEVYAQGLRNAYDLAWDGNGRLFAIDNAPDYGPPEEFHLVEPGGQHGYPWYECDDCFAAPADVDVIEPLHTFIPHAAPTGVTTYLAEQFPGFYNGIFVVLWSAFPGAQKVVYFDAGGANPTDFATGFALPIDAVVGPDGSLYVVDYATGVIFRIDYQG
ncbi:MAG: PQQ-dependent sugar dehydrogenase [Chloroflexota bacterium]